MMLVLGFFLVCFLLFGIVIADTILQYIFFAVYGIVIIDVLLDIYVIVQCYRKHGEFNGAALGKALLFIFLGIVAAMLQNYLLNL